MKTVLIFLLFSFSVCADELYRPQPGDIVVSTNPDRELQARYRRLGAGPPTHSSLVTYVWAHDRAVLVMLESVVGEGVIAVPFEELNDPTRTNIYVRTLRRPLTDRETARLTEWATQQLGKPYPATSKVYLSAIRGRPVRLLHLRPRVNERDWFCSGLVAAGIIVEGRINGAHVRPELVMPADLITDRELDLSREYRRPRRLHGGYLLTQRKNMVTFSYNMFPRLATNGELNCREANSKTSGYGIDSLSSFVPGSTLTNALIGELRQGTCFTTRVTVFRNFVSHVVSRCSKPKVIDIDASGVVSGWAVMENVKSFRDWSNCKLVGYSRSSKHASTPFARANYAVTAGVFGSNPDSAATFYCRTDITTETFSERYSCRDVIALARAKLAGMSRRSLNLKCLATFSAFTNDFWNRSAIFRAKPSFTSSCLVWSNVKGDSASFADTGYANTMMGHSESPQQVQVHGAACLHHDRSDILPAKCTHVHQHIPRKRGAR